MYSIRGTETGVYVASIIGRDAGVYMSCIVERQVSLCQVL